MIFTRHTHCFSKCQLEAIIDSYLSLAPYYQVLIKCLKTNIQKFEQKTAPHAIDHPHPIRVYTRDHQCSKNILQQDNQQSTELRTDLRSTYASNNLRYFYLFPLQYIVSILFLPQNIIVNGLFTATNIQIIVETLTIVSEEMSKKIRSTIAGKQLAPAKNQYELQQDMVIQEDDRSFGSVRGFEGRQGLPFSSIVEIEVDEEEEKQAKEEQKCPVSIKSASKFIKREIAGTKRFINIDRDIAEFQCRFCQGYLIYLHETVGQNPLDEDINRFSQDSVKYLNLISQVVPHFTLYLSETNQTQIPNDIHIINKILNPLGLVITEDIFSSQLNPKNATPQPTTFTKPKNLLQELQPYFSSIQKKRGSPNYYSVEQLFRMIIYCPTTSQVKEQLKQYQLQQFLKENGSNCSNEGKSIINNYCEIIKRFEQQQLTIAKNIVNIKPIYKQLQFPEEKIELPNSKPTHYSTANNFLKNNSSKISGNDRSLTSVSNLKDNPSAHLPRTITLQYSQLRSRQPQTNKTNASQDPAKKTYKNVNSKSKQRKGKEKKIFQELNVPEFGSMAMSAVLKRSILKSPVQTKKDAQKMEHQQLSQPSANQFSQGVLSISAQIVQATKKAQKEQSEDLDQLSDEQFRRIIYNSYNKRNNITKPENNYFIPAAQTAPNPSSFLTQSTLKTKKNNAYSSSLSAFIGRKQEKQQMDCIQKKEKEMFNKQLLNGDAIRSQIYEEIKRGEVQIYEDYASTFPLSETLKMSRKDTPIHDSKKTLTSSKSRVQSPNSSSNKKINVISDNSTKYNETGIIRNQKYSKSIKTELINHRYSYIRANEKENNSKFRLAQTSNRWKLKESKEKTKTLERYQLILKETIEEREKQKSQALQGQLSHYHEQITL